MMMCKKLMCLAALMLGLSLILENTVYGFDPVSDPSLVGWWSFDEGQGTVVRDSSGYGRDGVLLGGATWTEGRFGDAIVLDGNSGHASVPDFSLITDSITFVLWFNGWKGGDWAPFISSRGTDSCEMNFGNDMAGALRYTWNNDSSSTWGWAGGPAIPPDTWCMLAVTVAPDQAIAYVYTDEGGLTQSTNYIGHIEQTLDTLQIGYSFESRYLRGILDEAAVYSRALSQAEILRLTKGPVSPLLASDPTPEDASTDVPRNTVLGWIPGESAATHNIYFGTGWADVNSASTVNALDVLVSEGQTDSSFIPAHRLVYGQTYYWRVDEVNDAPDYTVTKGKVWSFTVEPYAYPIEMITATASSSGNPETGPEKTIDGSGLNDADQHSTDPTGMWLSSVGTQAWIQYEFDRPYHLHEMWVWNSNQLIESLFGLGAKDVAIEYSGDGVSWETLASGTQFAQGSGSGDYAANTLVSFGGATAQYVRITINSAWGIAQQYGLSEVRFYSIPMKAREPQPSVGEISENLDVVLKWRPGRQAASHQVLLSDDPGAVADGTAIVDTTTAASYSLSALDLQYGTTYYWSINEINEASMLTMYTGDVWSFTTPDHGVIDDFDPYDDDCNRIFFTWLDGLGHVGVGDCHIDGQPGNGSSSMVGYDEAPYAEESVVISGQSLPLAYDNALEPYYSEATSGDFALPSDWARGGVDTLSLQFRGYPSAFRENPDGSVVLSSASLDIGGNTDEFRYVYKRLRGDGSIIVRIDNIANTNPWAKCGVMIRETLDSDSVHAMVAVTPENGVVYQDRNASAGPSWDESVNGPQAPYWLRLTRSENKFSAAYSEDGIDWVSFTLGTVPSRFNRGGPVREVLMKDDVYIGLAVTSQTRDNPTVAHVSEVSMSGDVTGQWQAADIGWTQYSNDAEPLYITVRDASGQEETVRHADPDAVLSVAWQAWQIPLSEFSMLDLSSIESLTIGLGDRDNPRPGGAGMLYIDSIYLTLNE